MTSRKNVNKNLLGVGWYKPTPAAKRYVGEVLKSGRLSYGPFTRSFERRFSQAHGCQYGLMVNSGTSALRIAVACLKEAHGWRAGDEGVGAATTFVALANG